MGSCYRWNFLWACLRQELKIYLLRGQTGVNHPVFRFCSAFRIRLSFEQYSKFGSHTCLIRSKVVLNLITIYWKNISDEEGNNLLGESPSIFCFNIYTHACDDKNQNNVSPHFVCHQRAIGIQCISEQRELSRECYFKYTFGKSLLVHLISTIFRKRNRRKSIKKRRIVSLMSR